MITNEQRDELWRVGQGATATARRFILLAALLTLCAIAFAGGCACIALMDDARCDDWTDTMVQRWEGCR